MAKIPFDRIEQLAAGLTDHQLAAVAFRGSLRAFPAYDTQRRKSERALLTVFKALSDIYYLLRTSKRGLYGEIYPERTLKELFPLANNLGFQRPEIEIHTGGEAKDDLILNLYMSALALPESLYHQLEFLSNARYAEGVSRKFDRQFLLKAIFLNHVSFLKGEVDEEIMARFTDNLRRDISYLYGRTIEALLAEPLWSAGIIPGKFVSDWQNLQDSLNKREAHWDVWLDWYGGMLDGHHVYETYVNKADAFGSTVLSPIWKKGVKFINGQIRNLIDFSDNFPELEEFDIPEQRAAPLMTFDDNGRVARVEHLQPSEIGNARETRRQSGYVALIESLDDFEAVFAPDNHPGLKRAVIRIRAALGESYSGVDIIRLGAASERIQQYAIRADELFMPDMAAELVAFNINLASNLTHFDEWIAFKTELEGDPNVDQTVTSLAVEIASVVSDLPIIETGVKTELLDEMQPFVLPLEGRQSSSIERKVLLRGLSNVTATCSKILVNYAKKVGGSVYDGHLEGIKDGAKATTLTVFIGLSAQMLELAHVSPLFAFLVPVLMFLSKYAPK